MLGITVAWGTCFLFIRWGLRDAPVLWFAALRALLAGAALLAVARLQRRRSPRGYRAWALVTVLAGVNVTLAFAAMFAGVIGLATGTASVLANAQPLLILLPAWWFYGERLSAPTMVALAVGFAGLVVMATPGGGGDGAWLSVGAAAAITTGTLLARQLGDLDVIAASGWHFLIGGVGLAVWAGVVEGVPDIAWTPRFVAALLFVALIGTAAAFVGWFTEAKRSRLDALTAWTFLVPVVGIGLAAAVLGERPAGWTLIGLVVVLAALWIVVRPRRESNAPTPSSS
jgi:drug/metabolite transporter (DMT)-like permease